jgi:4-diphosphocytidyl-2-C-methyl-D-erythritol kinase
MISFPNAKINIGLYVVEKRPDGYHNLETIFYPVKLTDALEIVKSDKTEFTSSGIPIGGDSENNLVMKAFRLLEKDYGLPTVKIHLHKVIPFGAGLGGGSANAAFTLKILNDLFQLGLSDEKLQQYATQIGADCPFFIQNKPTFASGIGDQFEPVTLDLSAYHIVIVKPNCSVSTPEAYRNIVPLPSDFNLKEIQNLPIEEWQNVVKNDFERGVFPQYRKIENLKNKLYEMGAVYASMSGSGSAVFAVFNSIPINLHEKFSADTFVYTG